MRLRVFLALGSILLATACATAMREGDSGRSRDVITAQEIQEAVANTTLTNAYDVVQRLRPRFLRPRRTAALNNTIREPIVYVDTVRRGGTAELRFINHDRILEIRYLRTSEANMRFGIGHDAGAIMIVTK